MTGSDSWSVRSMLPNGVFRNNIKRQSLKTLLSQMGSTKVQSKTWRKKHGIFTPWGTGEASQCRTILECL